MCICIVTINWCTDSLSHNSDFLSQGQKTNRKMKRREKIIGNELGDVRMEREEEKTGER